MQGNVIKGTLYLLPGNEGFYTGVDVKDVFTGVIAIDPGIPFYVLNADNNTKLCFPREIFKENRYYRGVVHLRYSPSLKLPNSRKASFAPSKYYEFLRTSTDIFPLTNVAYIEFQYEGTNYIAIPTNSVAGIQYEFVM